MITLTNSLYLIPFHSFPGPKEQEMGNKYPYFASSCEKIAQKIGY